MYISQLKGYLLEDYVSKLLEINGFQLITHVDKNNKEFTESGNGLNLVGRGGHHQFDSLGEFKWNIPFTYPVRLFTEVKYTSNKIGINMIRQAIGILTDLNHNYSTVKMENEEMALPKYNYHYSLFSVTGFTEPAFRMALAHKIYLIDMSGEEFAPLINSLDDLIEMLRTIYPDKVDDTQVDSDFAKKIRKISRSIINDISHPDEIDEEYISITNQITESEIFYNINNIGGIYLASIGGPNVIALVPNNDRDFKESLRMSATQEVEIYWTDEESSWIITNEIYAQENEVVKFTLSFKIPKSIKDHVFSDNKENILETAYNSKAIYFSKFDFVAYLDENEATVCSLRYNKKVISLNDLISDPSLD